MQVAALDNAFYDAMFDSSETELNALENETMDQVKRLLNSPADLSSRIRPMPAIQVQLLQLANKPDANYEDYAQLIGQDPALASRVLRTVNSVLYTSGIAINNLQNAIARLGTQEVARIASSIMMEEMRPPNPIYFKLFGKQIWIHSLHCAYLCKLICEHAREDAFFGHFLGLIHDIGKILIFDCLTDALSSGNLEDQPGSKIFKQMMSEMSLDMSYFISSEWQLPEEFCTALQQQRTGIESRLAKVLFQANLCAEFYLLMEKNKASAEDTEALLAEIGLEPALWDEFCNYAKKLATSI